ncbi:hypothetical protein FJU42_20490, partial [Acinetobacter baumannii]
IVLYLIVSSYLRRSKDADEKTLRPMSEWVILANSGTKGHREKMSYSLIVQAAAILESQKVLPNKSLRSLMISKPELSKSNFVLLIMESTAELCPNEFEFLKKSYKTEQARVHLAQCIGLILHHGGESALAQIALAACSEPID